MYIPLEPGKFPRALCPRGGSRGWTSWFWTLCCEQIRHRPAEPLTIRHAREVAEFALKSRLPSMFESEEFLKAGGLMSYGFNYTALWPRAAVFVAKILKGANPANLPVEPPKMEFAINLQTARKLGVTTARNIVRSG